MIEQVSGAALGLSAILTLVCGYRVLRGPTPADRAVALDAIGTNVIALAVLFAIHSGESVYINISLMLAITGFMTTLVVSMYLEDGEVIG
jgi:multicomponent Na+:H+ antiporter subunit F